MRQRRSNLGNKNDWEALKFLRVLNALVNPPPLIYRYYNAKNATYVFTSIVRLRNLK
jgi:hypothetical protein